MSFKMKEYCSSKQMVIDVASSYSLCDDSSENPVGMYANLGENAVGLYLVDSDLLFWWNNQSYPIKAGWVSSWKNQGDLRTLKVTVGKQEFFTEYATDSPVSTQYYSEDEEDSDFGLWLHNVLSSAERTKIILSAWKDGV